jgi:hypothetical protein
MFSYKDLALLRLETGPDILPPIYLPLFDQDMSSSSTEVAPLPCQ